MKRSSVRRIDPEILELVKKEPRGGAVSEARGGAFGSTLEPVQSQPRSHRL